MKRFFTVAIASAMILAAPTMAFAKGGYSGGSRGYSGFSSSSSSGHSSGGFFSSGSSSKSYSTPSTSSKSTGVYHSGTSSYSSGSTYKPSTTTTTKTTTTRTSGTRSGFGGSYGYGYNGYGYYPGHFGSFASGFFVGSMFHPFGWGYGGGYYGGGAYYGSAGWGGAGYSPFWSILGLIVDILVLLFFLWLVVKIVRAFGRRRPYYAPSYQPDYGQHYDDYETTETVETVRTDRTPAMLDETAVVDACCEYIARVRRCRPEDVSVDLIYDPDKGYSADTWISASPQTTLSERELLEAIRAFVANREQVASSRIDVNLECDDLQGVHASAYLR